MMSSGDTKCFKTPSDNDVLIGRSNECSQHCGNQWFLQEIKERFDEYKNAPARLDYNDQGTRKIQSEIREELLNHVRERGGRFLIRKNKKSEAWEEATIETARRNVKNRLKNLRRNFRKLELIAYNQTPGFQTVKACPKCGVQSVEPEKCLSCMSQDTEGLEDLRKEYSAHCSPKQNSFFEDARNRREHRNGSTTKAGFDHETAGLKGSPRSVVPTTSFSALPDDQEKAQFRQDTQQIECQSLSDSLSRDLSISSVSDSGFGMTKLQFLSTEGAASYQLPKSDSSTSIATPSNTSRDVCFSNSSSAHRIDLVSVVPRVEAGSRRSSGVSSILVSDFPDDMTDDLTGLSAIFLQDDDVESLKTDEADVEILLNTLQEMKHQSIDFDTQSQCCMDVANFLRQNYRITRSTIQSIVETMVIALRRQSNPARLVPSILDVLMILFDPAAFGAGPDLVAYSRKVFVEVSGYAEAINVLNQNPGEEQVMTLAMKTLRYCHAESGLLHNQSALQAVLRSMRLNRAILGVQLEGCRFVLKNLVIGQEDNRGSIAAADDSASAVVAAMNAHAANAQIQATGCLALGKLSLHGDRCKMIGEEAVRDVLRAMHHHAGDTAVLEHGCFAIAMLARGNSPFVTVIAPVKAVLDAMTYHASHPKVQRNGCSALCELSANPITRELVASAHGISGVVSAMHVHFYDQSVQENGCRTLKWLALNPDNNELSMAIPAVAVAMRVHKSSENIQKHGCDLFAVLARGSSSRQRQILGAGAVNLIASAKSEFPTEMFHRRANDALRALGVTV